MAQSVAETREALRPYKDGRFRKEFSGIAARNNKHFRYWQEAGGLELPDIGDLNFILSSLEEAATRIDRQLAIKQANLTEVISDGEAEAALDAWETACKQVITANATIDSFCSAVRKIKESVDLGQLPRLEENLERLQATKRRYQSDVCDLENKLRTCQQRREGIAALIWRFACAVA